jgi:hypothetical protein
MKGFSVLVVMAITGFCLFAQAGKAQQKNISGEFNRKKRILIQQL